MTVLYQFRMRLRYISLTLEEWDYTSKTCLRRLNLTHLYKEMVLVQENQKKGMKLNYWSRLGFTSFYPTSTVTRQSKVKNNQQKQKLYLVLLISIAAWLISRLTGDAALKC